MSYRARNGADYRCCPGLISFTKRVHGCSAKPAESGGSRRSCSTSCVAERSAFEAVPARLSGSASVEIGESPRCCPVLRGLRDRCIAAMLATQSGSQWTCSTSCDCSSVRFPTGGGALVRFDFQKVAAPDGFAPSTSRVRAGRSRCLSYRAIRSANRSCTGLSPIPAAYVASNALAELKWSGTSEAAEGNGGCRQGGRERAAPSICRSSGYAIGAPRLK